MATSRSDFSYFSALKVSLDQKSILQKSITCPICTAKKPYLLHACENSLSHQMCMACVEQWRKSKHGHCMFQCPFCRRTHENTNHMTIIGHPDSIYNRIDPKNKHACIIPRCPKHCGDNSAIKCEPIMSRNKRYSKCKAAVCNPLHRLVCPFRLYSNDRGWVVIWSAQ